MLSLQQCAFDVTLAYLTFEEFSHLESTRHLLSNLLINYLSMKVVWLNSHFLVSWLDISANTAYLTLASIIHTAGFFSPFWVFYNHLYDDEYPHSESYLRIINWGFWWSQCNEIRFNCAWIFPNFLITIVHIRWLRTPNFNGWFKRRKSCNGFRFSISSPFSIT